MRVVAADLRQALRTVSFGSRTPEPKSAREAVSGDSEQRARYGGRLDSMAMRTSSFTTGSVDGNEGRASGVFRNW